jgi:hypothetical protein
METNNLLLRRLDREVIIVGVLGELGKGAQMFRS